MRALIILLVAGMLPTQGMFFSWKVPTSASKSQPVYDVTTVYKLRGEDTTYEDRGLVAVPPCYVAGNSCNWTGTGWRHSDSNYELVPYPVKVHEQEIATNREPHVFRKPADKFAISVKPSSSDSDFFIYLMTEEDVDHSDMLVLQVRNRNRGKSNAYECKQTNLADSDVEFVKLPTMEHRQCTLERSFYSGFTTWKTSSYESFNLEFVGENLELVYLGTNQIMNTIQIPREFRQLDGLIKFIGVRLDGAFKYSIPVDVLALSKRKGSLLSPVITPPSSLLCVQMSAYLHPDSGASVAMSLKFNNGTILNVGEIQPSTNKVEQWRFMSDFQADKDQPFRIQVVATRNNTKPVTFSGITTCNVTGEFGNLVLHQTGPAQVHLRTNSRGLPLLLPNGIITGPKYGVMIPDCSTNTKGCSWTQYNFTISSNNGKDKPPLYLGKKSIIEIEDYTTRAKPVSDTWTMSSPLNFTYDVTSGDGNGVVGIFLMDSRQDLTQSDMYFLDIRYYGNSVLYKCSSTDRNSSPTMPGGIRRSCSEKQYRNYGDHFGTNFKFTFNLEIREGRIVFTSTRDLSQRSVFDWTDSDPIEITHFAFGSDNVVGTLHTLQDLSVFSLPKTQGIGSLASPPLPPSLERVCVSLTFYTTSSYDVIELLLLQGDIESSLGSFTSGRGRHVPGWTHQHIMADVPSSSRGERRLAIKATKHQLDSPLYIQRVGGCNPQAPEDLVLMANQSRVFAVDVSLHEYSTEVLSACSNGGMRRGRHHGCVCRPGFSGPTCSEGCGANSYGADCGGVCSESSSTGCRGLALCSPLLGCDCGPGFKGLLCDTPCDGGEYGSGCRQRCGQCAGESCDAYTGVCHQGCQHGRYPPFCHDLYSYISPRPVVSVSGFYEVSVKADLQLLSGRGKPQFYQIQYKEENAQAWSHETPRLYSEGSSPRNDDDDVTMTSSPRDLGHVTGLRPGVDYLLRVVLIDETLASYQGSRIPTIAFSTPCVVPCEADYLYYKKQDEANNIRSILVRNDGFEVEWKVSRGNATWCSLIGYELHVTADWRKMVHSVASDVTRMSVAGLSPGKEYNVKVRGVTSRGPTAFSQSLTLTTTDLAPDHVVNLRSSQTTERSIKISWEKPRRTAGVIRRYLVRYQCLHLGACPEVDCASSAGQQEVMATSAQLDGLLPYALYNISVAGISGSLGLTSSMQAVTALSAPDVTPSSVTPGVLSRSNSSLTVQWAPPSSCRQLNGYLTGYRYELFSPGQKSALLVGTTTNHKASFSGLEPHSEFLVRVFVTNSVGWSSTQVLEINAKTRATTPEVVENLTVYKRGRRFVGLRWSAPRLTYGSLESFTVSHRPMDDETRKPVTATLKPSPCPAWPQLFCHTIKNLKADTDYVVAVQARNSEVPEDGDEVTINATTKEGAPGAPSYLRVVNKTDVSMTIEWGLPDLVNGQLRSFLVNIEETDSHNSSDCCQYFPLREVIVTEEKFTYQFQMTGLKQSSSYEVGVTAKTVSLGPALSITAHTRPRTPVLTHAPELAEPALAGKNLKIRVHPEPGYEADIVSGYLLLLKTEASSDDSSLIIDDWLANELNVAMNGSFSLVAEFTHADLPESRVVELHPGQPLVDGVFGYVGLGALAPDSQYEPVWVMVLEYCGARSVGQIRGKPFTVSQA